MQLGYTKTASDAPDSFPTSMDHGISDSAQMAFAQRSL